MSRFVSLVAASLLLLGPLAAARPHIAPKHKAPRLDPRIEKESSVISARAAEAKAAADVAKLDEQLHQAQKAQTEARAQARETEKKAMEALKATDAAKASQERANKAQATAKEARKGARAAADAAQKAAHVQPTKAKPKAEPVKPETPKADVPQPEVPKAETITEK